MEYINVVIESYLASKMVEYKDNNILESGVTVEANTSDSNVPRNITTKELLKVVNDEQKVQSLPKWANGFHAKENIISGVDGCVKLKDKSRRL